MDGEDPVDGLQLDLQLWVPDHSQLPTDSQLPVPFEIENSAQSTALIPSSSFQNDVGPSLPIFVPEDDEDKLPTVGQLFENIEDAFNAYNAYAKVAGFSVRRSSEKRVNNEVVRKKFVCSKEGCRKEKIGHEIVNQRRTSDTRENCGAFLQIKKTKDGQWMVFKVVMEHSHILSTPKKTHMLRSHRSISAPKKKLIDTYGAANIRPNKQMGLLVVQAGGRDKVGFTETDFRNHIRDKREEIKDGDGDMFYAYFSQMKEKDPRNFYSIEKDDEDHIRHVVWADYYFQKSYEEFGDVVSFNTTYNTNRYGLIFGAFTGVNHHNQSILFGCCLISNETFDTFVWVFKKWIEAMPGDPPKSILTDQDPAMTKAIRFVFPTISHRYCLWHIMENLQKNLGGVAIHKGQLIPTIKKITYNSITIEDFEMDWKNMLEEYDVANNDWLNVMYNIRHMWIPIYMRHLFFAGMSTTSRSESINAFLKQHVTQKNGLCDFMFRFEQGIATQKYRQLKENHDTQNGRPKLMTDLPMEQQMSEIYTKKMFYKFQDQFMYITSGIAELVKDEVDQRIYIVSSFKNDKEIQRTVVFKKDSKDAKCSCHLFEFQGIPCGHIICVLKQEKIYTLPQQFIMRRWTRHARVDDDSDKNMSSSFDGSLLARHGDLSYDTAIVVDEASLSKEAYYHAKRVLQELKKSIREINEKEVRTEDNNKRKDNDACSRERYLAPKNAITKGRPKRLKSSKENAMKKDRLCRGCGKHGVAHDRRNCPALIKSSVVHVSANDESGLENHFEAFIDCEDRKGRLLRMRH